MAFDDGTPLDAAKLQALETELFSLRSSIPKVGNSTNINVENKTIVQAQIFGGKSGSVSLIKGQEVEFGVTFTPSLQSNPIAVILTPMKTSGSFQNGDVSYYVLGNTLGQNGFRAKVMLSSTAKASFKIVFYYMVICA